MRKWVIAAVVAVAVIAAVLVVPSLLTGGQGATSAQDLNTETVERRTLNDTIESSGTITAERTIALSFGASGTVEQINVVVGDSVVAGQVLATLDTKDLQYQIDLQEQSMIVQQVNFDQLVAPPTASEIAQSQASVASASSQLLQAQLNLETAPNSVTINCADVTDRQRLMDDAQGVYDDYVQAGYEMDATFLPDSESEEGISLRDARQALVVAQAQCNNTTSVSEYEMQVASAQASLDQAQAALESLLAGASAEDIASAEAQLAQQQLELENVRAALGDAELIAPFAGIVSAVDIIVGSTINSSSAVIILIDNAQLHVNVPVDELDIPKLEVGQRVVVSPDALEDVALDGIVGRISPTSESTDGVVTYNVRIDLNDWQNLPVYVGMTTNIEIVLGSEPDVLVVPTDAIQRMGTTEFVQVLVNGASQNVNVTTGTTLDGYTMIAGNLNEGDEVVIPEQTTQSGGGGFGGPFGG